ncbi:MAG: hypothetical protein RLY86_669 [Pseudomonadota bacterium]|jgi:hypothetical protein
MTYSPIMSGDTAAALRADAARRERSQSGSQPPVKTVVVAPPVAARPATASTYGAVPASPEQMGPPPELRWLPLSALYIDHRYQREVSQDGGRNVGHIIERFRWRDFGVLLVAAMPDGRYAVIDGQHRYLAASCHPAVTDVPCAIVSAEEMPEQARTFVAVNRDRKALNAFQLHHANVAAGDKDARRIQAVVDAAGMVVPRNNLSADHYRLYHLCFVSGLAKQIWLHGDEVVIDALKVARGAAEKVEGGRVRGPIVAAVAALLKRHPGADHDRLVKLLVDRPGDELQEAASAYRKMFGGTTAAALEAAVVKAYNASLPADRRLPEGGSHG